MGVENQDQRFARPLELQGTSEEDVHRQSKTVYTREFLLSCAELDDCKQFLTGFDPSVFRPSKLAYTREFLLSRAEVDVCKQLPTGFDPLVFRPSKTKHTREFLLSCAELDVCKQLPEGFDSSALLELEDDFKGILEPWKGSGILLLPNSDTIRCRAQFRALDSNGSSRESVGRSDYLLGRRESNSQGSYHSDFRRHDDRTQSLVKVSGCNAKDMAEKNDYCQLSKSENPYRPPHSYQGGRTKDESKSHFKETVVEKMGSGVQEDTQLEGPRIAEGEQHEIIKDATSLAESIPSCPVYHVKPFCHDFNFIEHNVTSDCQIMRFGCKKASTSIITEDLNEEQSRMSLKEDIASFLKVPSGCSSTVTEKALPQPLAVNSECEKGFFGKTCFPITKAFCSVPKNSSEGNTDFHMIQPHESISGIEFNTREEISELYKFPFTLPYDLISSVLCEHNPMRTNHQGISADASEVIDSYDMEENECTFDDMWSNIMEILQFDQEMELASSAESNQTADFEVQSSLPDEQSLISIDNPVRSEHSTCVPLNSSNDIAHYDAEIHFPDENSLITIDDLIAPEARLLSTDHTTRAEQSKFVPLDRCFGAADNADIHLPDEDDLITMDDLIAPNHLKLTASGQPETESTWMSNVRNEVARSGALVITDPAKASATQGLEVPPSVDMTASEAYQELQFCHSFLHNPCNSTSPETAACYPFNSLESQMSLQTTFVGPLPHCCWYSCLNMVHQFPGKTASSKLNEFSYPHFQYSQLQQPTKFLQQNHLPAKDGAFSNLEVEKKQHFPLRHRQSAYPDLAIAKSAMLLDPLGVEGYDHQMVGSTKPKNAAIAWHGQRASR